tara:strand:- start:16163 stop:17029 length:867 start_codon:yes stop_codon:yes gene_type:complete
MIIFAKLLVIFINVISNIINFFKRNNKSFFKSFIYDNLRQTYYEINVNDQKISFFCPSQISVARINDFFSKEPETLDWIDSFENSSKIIFWDIGANIGLYSLYTGVVKNNIKVFSFEPSSLNLNLLSRNISINNKENNIFLYPSPLSNKPNTFSIFKETNIIEGGSMSAFGIDFGHDGKRIHSINKTNVFGTTIDELVNNNKFEIPDYIKIDVDGIEHLILEGASKTLKNKKIKSILIELNHDFEHQYLKSKEILESNGFKLNRAVNNELMQKSNNFQKTFNHIFYRH